MIASHRTDREPDRFAWPWGQPNAAIIQCVYTTADIDAEMMRYATGLGIGPWFIRRDFGFDRLMYRGTPAIIGIDLAIAFSGGMMIELIQQTDDAPSPYREIVEARGHGFHHWAFGARPGHFATRLGALEDQGYAPILELGVELGGRTTMLDPGSGHAGYIELIEVMPDVEALFDSFYTASRGWDGSDPIRGF